MRRDMLLRHNGRKRIEIESLNRISLLLTHMQQWGGGFLSVSQCANCQLINIYTRFGRQGLRHVFLQRGFDHVFGKGHSQGNTPKRELEETTSKV